MFGSVSPLVFRSAQWNWTQVRYLGNKNETVLTLIPLRGSDPARLTSPIKHSVKLEIQRLLVGCSWCGDVSLSGCCFVWSFDRKSPSVWRAAAAGRKRFLLFLFTDRGKRVNEASGRCYCCFQGLVRYRTDPVFSTGSGLKMKLNFDWDIFGFRWSVLLKSVVVSLAVKTFQT